MSTSPDSSQTVPPATPEKSRVGRILLWSARITSLPILAMVLLSLIPTLAHFSVAAKDDKLLAACLCGTSLGLVIGWRWAGIGGALVVASVGVIMAQNDGGPFADPFTVAFGLQGILFLLSWGLNHAPSRSGQERLAAGWLRKAAVGALALGALAGAVVLFRGPDPDPLPRGKEVLAGLWESATGLRLEVTAEGKVSVSCGKDAKVDAWNLPVPIGGTNVFNLYVRNDDTLEMASGVFGSSKTYHVDRWPRRDAKQMRLVLNGSDPYNPKGGVVLLKKSGGETNSPPPTPKSHT